MSGTHKRTLSQELESEEVKGLVIPSSRPMRPPTKRRKTEESPEVARCSYSDAGVDQRVASKGKRQAWTAAAIEAFFEGLYQHGKHFHRILKHMQNKQKKLNDPLIPNLTKDQVRFFYYRTWHKVESHLDPAQQIVCDPLRKTKQSQSSDNRTAGENHLDLSLEEEEITELTSPKKPVEIGDGSDVLSSSPTSLESCEKIKEQIGTSPSDKGDSKVKDVVVNGRKQSLDLVALICYHKLKQKCQVDHNFWKRLSELVYHGTTTIPSRVKGKRRIQIKVPNCVALRGKLRLPLISEDQIVERMDESDDITERKSDSAEQGTAYRNLLESDSYLSTEGPSQVILELRPLTTFSWAYIQGLSQNPRIRITMGASKRLVELLQVLSLRWKIDQAAISIYHVYSKCRIQKHTTVASKYPEMRESCCKDFHVVSNYSTTLCRDVSDKVLVDRIDKEPSTSNGTRELLIKDGSGVADFSYLDTSSLEDQSFYQLEYSPHTTLEYLHNQFCQPECVQLLYSITHVESTQLCDRISDRLKILLKVVDFMTKESNVDSQNLTQSPKYTPVKVTSVVHQSSKVVEYMKSLERRSPRKSPLAKYHKLRRRSPYKMQLKPPKSKLDFSPPQLKADAASSTSILNTLVVGKSSPEVIQLSNPHPSLKLNTSKETETTTSSSFITTKLQDVLTTGAESKPQTCSAPITAIALQPGHHVLRPRHTVTPCGVSDNPIDTSVPTSTISDMPGLYQSPVTENTQSFTRLQTACSQFPVVSALKPFSKPRRTKKAINRLGPARQLVPRPLPFLPHSQESNVRLQSHHGLLPTLSTTLNLPSSTAREVSSKEGHSNQQKLVCTLLQALIQQQTQLKQQLNLTSDSATASIQLTENETTEIVNVNDSHIEDDLPGVLDSVLNDEEKISIFNTSSDTVNKLLRGLSLSRETESIRKLSEETANVLPSFGQSSQPFTGELSFPERLHQKEDKNSDTSETTEIECVQNPVSSADFQGNLTDFTSKQTVERENVTESDNALIQLREVSLSPDRFESDLEPSISQQARDQSDGDPTYRSLMEESSVDYIQKFKELASSMDKESLSS